MDVFRRYLCSGGSHRRGISNSESISLERRDSDNERSRQTSRKSKGRETFRSKITANVFVNAFMYLWRSKRYRSFFAFHFSVSVFVVATVTMLDRKIAAVPADNTMRRDVRPSSAVSCSFPCLPSAPSQTNSLRYIHGRTRPSSRSNICPSINLHCVFRRLVTTIPRDLSRDRSFRRSQYGQLTDDSIPLIIDHSFSRILVPLSIIRLSIWYRSREIKKRENMCQATFETTSTNRPRFGPSTSNERAVSDR